MAIPAGALRSRVSFYQRKSVADGNGRNVAGYADPADLTVRANIRPKLAGDGILTARLAGITYANITVRQSDATRAIDVTWKAVDADSGQNYAIKSKIDPDAGAPQQGSWFEFLCEAGTREEAELVALSGETKI